MTVTEKIRRFCIDYNDNFRYAEILNPAGKTFSMRIGKQVFRGVRYVRLNEYQYIVATLQLDWIASKVEREFCEQLLRRQMTSERSPKVVVLDALLRKEVNRRDLKEIVVKNRWTRRERSA